MINVEARLGRVCLRNTATQLEEASQAGADRYHLTFQIKEDHLVVPLLRSNLCVMQVCEEVLGL